MFFVEYFVVHENMLKGMSHTFRHLISILFIHFPLIIFSHDVYLICVPLSGANNLFKATP